MPLAQKVKLFAQKVQVGASKMERQQTAGTLGMNHRQLPRTSQPLHMPSGPRFAAYVTLQI
jgi:hypothetical protein